MGEIASRRRILQLADSVNKKNAQTKVRPSDSKNDRNCVESSREQVRITFETNKRSITTIQVVRKVPRIQD